MSPREASCRALAAAAAGALAGVVALTGAARAETVDATSTTLLSGRADPRDGVVHTAVPAYELLTLRATDLRLPGVDDVLIVMSGWGAIELADRDEGRRGLGDLDIAFVEGKLWRRRVAARLGRQLIVAGAGRNLAFDGLALTVRPWRWVGVTAQGGVPVTPRFAVDRGDALVAARAFVKPAFDAEAGVSFLQVLDGGEIARRDLALDARWVPSLRLPLALSGFALWSLPERRLGEGNVAATYQINRSLELTGDYRRTAPDLFLPRNSIFSVFSQETRDEAGGYVYARPVRRLRLQGEYHVIVDAAGTGHDGSGKVTGTFGAEGRDTLGFEARRLALPQTGYMMGRAFSIVRVSPLVLATLDASAFVFDADVNGQRRSFVGAATLGYDFRPRWRAVVTGVGSVTPFVERRFEGMAKLVYQLTTDVHRRVAAAPAAPAAAAGKAAP
jgi:hypothetical protein